jgi:hypothetical protein
MIRSAIVGLVLLAGLMSPPAAAAGEEIAVAVMEFSSKGGIEPQKMEALSDMLANEIRRQGNYRVVGKSDIQAALQLEEQKQLLGCTDESCIAEIGGALGVRWVVVGNVSLFGETYLLNLKMMDVGTIKVVAGLSKKVTGGEDMLIDALGQTARELIAQAQKTLIASTDPTDKPPAGDTDAKPPDGLAVEPPEGQIEDAAPGKSSSLKTWGHITFWTGTGLLIVGAISGGLSKAAADKYNDATQTHEERASHLDDSIALAAGMWSGVSIGLALMTAGVVLWVIAPSRPESDAATIDLAPSAAVTPDGQGMMMGIGGRW